MSIDAKLECTCVSVDATLECTCVSIDATLECTVCQLTQKLENLLSVLLILVELERRTFRTPTVCSTRWFTQGTVESKHSRQIYCVYTLSIGSIYSPLHPCFCGN